MAENQTVNWGIIGPGKIANQFAQAVVKNQNCCLLGVASRDRTRALSFAEKYDIARTYSNYESMCVDDEIDAVYIATPHAFHYQQAKLCLEAGKHVLVEKPATINANQWKVLVQIAQKNQCALIEAVWSRFMPCFKQVKSWLSEGLLGDLVYVQSDIGFSFLDVRGVNHEHRLLNPDLGGGALLDLGLYSVALSQLVVNSLPSEIQAMAHMGSSSVDLTTMANVRYANGVRAQFTCSAMAEHTNSMSIHGTRGKITLPQLFWFGGQAILEYLPKDSEDAVTISESFTHDVNGFEYQIAESVRCIKSGLIESELMTHQNTLENMQLMDKIRNKISLSYPSTIENSD